jgi:hypothetical protein
MYEVYLYFKLLLGTLLFSLVPSCVNSTTQKDSHEEINIESNINNFREFSLSQFNAEIRYIPLKKGDNLEISRIVDIDISSDLILVSNINMCLLFDHNGMLIRKIGKEGRGPNEYTIISHSTFGLKNNIYLLVIDKFLEYKTDGTFVSSFYVRKINNPEFSIGSFILINDSLFLGHTPLTTTGKDETKAILFNNKGIIYHEYKNYIFLNRSVRMFSSEDFKSSFYAYKGNTHFKEKMNDTLFCLTDKYELLPRLSFKLGKYSMPKKFRERFIAGANPPPWYNYIFVDNVYEISDYLLLDCQFNKYMPAKRFTPREILGIEIWNNTLNVIGLFNKENKSLFFCKPTSTDNPLFTSGLYNDIDAGPRFYPIKQVNDSTLVMWIEAKQLKDHIASNDFKNNNVKFPDKKNKLLELASRLNEFDNPVLMFVTFKK